MRYVVKKSSGETHDALQSANILTEPSEYIAYTSSLLFHITCIKAMICLQESQSGHDCAVYRLST
jgi:hypothetical protein